MARAHSASATRMHAANLALCEGGPAHEMSKAERRLHALNIYKAKRRVSLAVLQAWSNQHVHLNTGLHLQALRTANWLRCSTYNCAQGQCQLWAAA